MSYQVSVCNQPTHFNIRSRWSHWLKALPLAVMTTAGLLLGMERLIATAPVQSPDIKNYVVPEIVMPPREVIVRKDVKIEKPEPVEPVPTPPTQGFEIPPQTTQGFEPPRVAVERVAPGQLGFAANAPIATIMVQPDYPQRAAIRGIEGYVDVGFDVLASGATTNIRILAANPANIFDRAALQAVKNWKYSPVTVNGIAQPFQGMQQRLIFTLQN